MEHGEQNDPQNNQSGKRFVEKFMKIARYKDSDASKEIRKFIKRYLAENSQLFLEMEKRG